MPTFPSNLSHTVPASLSTADVWQMRISDGGTTLTAQHLTPTARCNSTWNSPWDKPLGSYDTTERVSQKDPFSGTPQPTSVTPSTPPSQTSFYSTKNQEDGHPDKSWGECKKDAIHKATGESFKREWGTWCRIVMGQKRLLVNREEAVVQHGHGFRLVQTVPFVPHWIISKLKKTTVEALYKKGCSNATFHDHENDPIKGLLWPNCPPRTSLYVP